MPFTHTPSLYGTTVHRVLAIPEIVELVFSFVDESEHVKNACVCKVWSEVALDLLWRRVEDLPRLFCLLAPMVEGDVVVVAILPSDGEVRESVVTSGMLPGIVAEPGGDDARLEAQR